MAEVQDLVIKIRTDKTEAEAGLKSLGSSFAGLSSLANPVTASLLAMTAGVTSLISAINRGQAVSELTSAFNNLEKQAGGSVAALDQLKAATGGLIDNLDLMRASNQALLAGLTPDQFLNLASAADTLGDAVGKNTKEALDDLTNALSTGNERMLKAYGITIDNAKAEEVFAKSLGTTADKLNEVGKKEAARIALMDAITAKTKTLGVANETAGDQLQKFGSSLSDGISIITKWVNESENLIFALKLIADTASNATSVLRYLFSNDAVAQGARIIEQQAKGVEKLAILQSQLAQTGTNAGARQITLKAIKDEESAQKALGEELTKLQAKYKLEQTELKKTGKEFIDTSKGAKELTDKVTEQALAFRDLQRETELKGLENPLTKAIKDLNVADFETAFTNYKTGLEKATREALTKQFSEALRANEIGGAEFEAELKARVEAGTADFPIQLQEGLQESFQNSVDFFADILTTTITGSAQDITEILTDALKRVAIGFGAQMLASMAGINISGITSAQGLGQSLASSAGFGGGGVSGIGSLFSGSGLGSLFGNSGASTAGAEFTLPDTIGLSGPTLSAGGAAGASGGAGFFAAAAPPIAAAFALYQVDQLIEKGLGKQKNKPLGIAAQALATGGAGLINNALNGDFFAGGAKRFEREDRENALSKLNSQTFQGVKGTSTLNSNNYNLDPSGFGSVAGGLASPLASSIAGGDGKLKDDLTAIFANATKEADNYNEVLINTQALMSSLGIDAEEAKNQLTSLFLDGKVGLDEYNAGIDNLNILMQNNLVGIGATADAVKLLNSDLSNNRVKLQAIGLAFGEMAEVGVESLDQITQYTAQFGPDTQALFIALKKEGIDTFEEIANASDEQIKFIFNTIAATTGHIATEFQELKGSMVDPITDGVIESKKQFKELEGAAKGAASRITSALQIRGSVKIDGLSDNNLQLNGRPA